MWKTHLVKVISAKQKQENVMNFQLSQIMQSLRTYDEIKHFFCVCFEVKKSFREN